MAEWGVCATVKAPTDQVLAFVAHHLGLGASHLWIFLDDPDDPAIDAVAGLSGVTATRCDDAYWQAVCKTRPEAHQNRQCRNMRRVYNLAALPFVAHLDVDEFLQPVRPISGILDSIPKDRIILRMAPWEALHDAAQPYDIFTATQFRAALKGPELSATRMLAFGQNADLLPEGVLSHAAGKCFFQRGFAGLQPRLHGGFLNDVRVQGGDFHPEIAVLHFHAEDPKRWLRNLQFRLTLGAYKFNPALQEYLTLADDAKVDAFYQAVQNPDDAVRQGLADQGFLMTVRLGLKDKVSDLPDRHAGEDRQDDARTPDA